MSSSYRCTSRTFTPWRLASDSFFTHFNFFSVFVTIFVIVLAPFFLSADSLVNINTADKATLMTLQGIGEVKAQAIIDYRATTPFVVIEDIMNVSGIGTATFEAIKSQITVGATETPSVQPTPQPTAQTTSQTPSGTGSQTSSVALVSRASAGSDRTVFVGTTIRFEGYAYDSSNKRIDEVRFQWAFGDGTSAEGRIATHRYDMPGRYAVSLKATRYESSATHRIVITVEEPRVILALLPQGGISITNNSVEDLDLSRWLVKDGTISFTFPEGTYLIGGETLALTVSVLKYYPTANAVLALPTGDVIATVSPTTEPVVEQSQSTATSSEDIQLSENEVALEVTPEEIEMEPLAEEILATISTKEDSANSVLTSTHVAAAAAAENAFSFSPLWWGGIFALFGLGGAAVFATRRLRVASPALESSTTHVDIKDWNIIDENEETR